LTQAVTPLAEDLVAPDDATVRARWTALVEKTLKGQSFDEALTVKTPDGLTIQPLYTAKDGVTVVARDLRARDAERPWDLRMRAAHPDPAARPRTSWSIWKTARPRCCWPIDPDRRERRRRRLGRRPGQGAGRRAAGPGPRRAGRRLLGPKAADWLGAWPRPRPMRRWPSTWIR
jgi:methylmalonyl-CoA mutase